MFPSPASGRKSWNSSPKSVDDITLAQENGTAFTTPGALEIDTTSHAHELKKKDKELLDILKKHKPEDADIDKIKINKELDDAINGLQANIENDIDSLKAHKEMNLCLINKIKNEHTVLRDEKHYIEKQLELASRSCSGQNKRKSKEVYLLNIAYDKLDQKERSSRRRIAILQAELSLIILKLDVSNSKEEKSVVPPLDFTNINTGNKRRLKDQEPKLSNSTPILQNYEFVRPAPSVRDNRKIHPNKTDTLNGQRNQPDKKTVRQVIYKNKPVITRKD